MGMCMSQSKGDQILPTDQRRSSEPARRVSIALGDGEDRPGTCQLLTDTWSFDNFDLDLEGADWHHSFTDSRLLPSSAALLALRFFLAVVTTVVTALAISQYGKEKHASSWFLYLNSWTLLVTLAYAWGVFVAHIAALVSAMPPDPTTPRVAPPSTPWFINMNYVAYAIAVPFSVIVLALGYFGAEGAQGLSIGGWDTNTLPVIVMGASVLTNGFAYHILHTAYPMLFGLIYIGFTYTVCKVVAQPDSGFLVVAGFDWSVFETTGSLVIILGTLVNALLWFFAAYVRHLIDTGAWNRIYAYSVNAEVALERKGSRRPSSVSVAPPNAANGSSGA